MSGPVDPLLKIPEGRREALEGILQRLRGARSVLLTTHLNADGDGAGSEAAIAAWLESVGVRATVVNPTPFPPNLRFLLHRRDVVEELETPGADRAIGEADLALVLDTGEPRRIAPLDRLLQAKPTLVLDHHPAGQVTIGEGGVQDPSAAAVGELVHDLLTLSGGPWPPAAVQGVYVAIVSDTGSFRFSNTSPRTHVIAARMLERGVDPEYVFRKLFATAPLRRLELLREALGRLDHDPILGIAWTALPLSLTERLASTTEDFEGLIDQVRSIEGTQVALVFRETAPRETKVSLRALGETDVNRIARQFGGGGHVKAAGATVELPLEDAVETVLERVRASLRGARNGPG